MFTFDLRLNEYIGNLYRDETQDIFRRRKILTYQPLRNPKILTRKYVVIFKSKFISQVVILYISNRIFHYVYRTISSYITHLLVITYLTFNDLIGKNN